MHNYLDTGNPGYTLMTKMLTTLTIVNCIIIQLQMRNMTLKK